jgi:hypothetical protein
MTDVCPACKNSFATPLPNSPEYRCEACGHHSEKYYEVKNSQDESKRLWKATVANMRARNPAKVAAIEATARAAIGQNYVPGSETDKERLAVIPAIETSTKESERKRTKRIEELFKEEHRKVLAFELVMHQHHKLRNDEVFGLLDDKNAPAPPPHKSWIQHLRGAKRPHDIVTKVKRTLQENGLLDRTH